MTTRMSIHKKRVASSAAAMRPCQRCLLHSADGARKRGRRAPRAGLCLPGVEVLGSATLLRRRRLGDVTDTHVASGVVVHQQ